MTDNKNTKDTDVKLKVGTAGALGAAAGAAIGVMAAKALQKKENREKLGQAFETVKKHATEMMEDVKAGAKETLQDPALMNKVALAGVKGGKVSKKTTRTETQTKKNEKK